MNISFSTWCPADSGRELGELGRLGRLQPDLRRGSGDEGPDVHGPGAGGRGRQLRRLRHGDGALLPATVSRYEYVMSWTSVTVRPQRAVQTTTLAEGSPQVFRRRALFGRGASTNDGLHSDSDSGIPVRCLFLDPH